MKSRPLISDWSLGMESAFDTIHGVDERDQVKQTTRFPFRMIGRLGMGCTGTLIGPRHVLTAAHCIYNLKKREWRKALDFSPARDGANYPYGTLAWEHVYVPQGWTKGHSKAYDYALVILEKPVGKALGWLPFTHEAPEEKLRITGYPADKAKGTMWRTECEVKTATKTSYSYACDTFGGMSGSAVIAEGEKSDHTVYAIHAYGGFFSNSATRITEGVFDSLMAWKARHR